MNILPTTDEEFFRLMELFDGKFRDEEVPISHRASEAVSYYSKLFQLEIRSAPDSYVPVLRSYVGTDAYARIHRWFKDRYGDRQKISWGPGDIALVIRGDAWRMSLPLVLGQVQFVLDRDLLRYARDTKDRLSGTVPTANVLSFIKDLPQGFSSQLSDEECVSIFDSFIRSMECLNSIQAMIDSPYVPEAISDIQASVMHIFSKRPHYGQSKWSSAQAAEKFLKSLLKIKSSEVPHTHNIARLAQLAKQLGAAPLGAELIDCLQTASATRYGEQSVSIEDAVLAHYASLVVGEYVAEQLLDSKPYSFSVNRS